MPEQPTKLFAIVSTPFSRPDTGRVTPHIWGAIFDVDAQGNAKDFTAIDFDGANVRRWERNNFGSANPVNDHYAGLDQALFFPISDTSAALMQEAIEEVAKRVPPKSAPCRGLDPKNNRNRLEDCENPFYFDLYPKDQKNAELERHGRVPVDFSGKPIAVSHTERLSYQRPAHGKPRAATNCVNFLQEVLEKIGGIPLDGFVTPTGEAMPRDGNPFHMEAYLKAMVGNQGKLYNEKQSGRMLELPSGAHAYAYDRIDSCGSLTYALNSQKHQQDANGNDVTLAQYLLAQKPLYDPTLNEYDLAPSAKPVSPSR